MLWHCSLSDVHLVHTKCSHYQFNILALNPRLYVKEKAVKWIKQNLNFLQKVTKQI